MPGPVCMDTLQMSRALFPQEKHHRLQDLIRRFGIAENEEHRALSDAAQTQECFEWMRRYTSERGGGFTTVFNASILHPVLRRRLGNIGDPGTSKGGASIAHAISAPMASAS